MLLEKLLNKLKKFFAYLIILWPQKADDDQVKKVYDFFCNYNNFRSLEKCAEETGINIFLCQKIKNKLYKQRKLGLYYFEANNPPHKYMRDFILKRFSDVDKDSYILEVGPGENPIFSFTEYANWYGVDKNLKNGVINFKENKWAKDLYPKEKIFVGGFENLTEVFVSTGLIEKFDMVVACHSYEHTFKPVESLINMRKMLKKDGILVLFVPDAYTDDPNSKDLTHTLYINNEMMKDFFKYAGGFKDISITNFRPNADLVISAIKI